MVQELGDLLGAKAKESKAKAETQGLESGTISTYFLFGNYRLRVRVTRALMESQTIGTAFILGHPNNGVLGTSTLGEGTLGSFTQIELLNIVQAMPDEAVTQLAKWLAGESATAPDNFAAGTGSTAFVVTDTTLGTEVDRTTIDTFTTSTDKIATFVTEIKSIDTGFHGSAMREIGLFNDASAGEMFARVIISSLTMDNTKNYRFTIDLELFDDTTGNALFTTAGLNEIRDWLGSVSATAPTHMAWGTGTTSPAVGDTTLEGEQQRNALDDTSRVNNVISFQSILTSAQANGTSITKSGLFNAGASGDLFFETKFGAISKSALFQITETDRVRVI